jgi:hypothetical protein
MGNRPLHFVTLSGVPIHVSELKWPFHPSTSGADWHVLHGRAELLGNNDGLHVEVAVGMTQTMKDALGSLEPDNAESMVVNAIRKTIDNGQLAFVKSGKLQPCDQPFLQLRDKENSVSHADRAGRNGDAEAARLLAGRQVRQRRAGERGASLRLPICKFLPGKDG